MTVPDTDPPDGRIPVGVSACLLGTKVRFDGGHKRDTFLVDTLGRYVEWVPVCPEDGAGLGTPREAMRLAADGGSPRPTAGRAPLLLVGARSGRDFTDTLLEYTDAALDRLAGAKLRAFVLKRGSPSCGTDHVKVYDANGAPTATTSGVFAKRLMGCFPHLPVEEEGRLCDPRIREHFVTRLFCRDRWLRLLETSPAAADLAAFHTRHKMLVLAHDPARYRELEPVVAGAGVRPIAEVLARYADLFFPALGRPSTPGRHAIVMQHFAGFLKDDLSGTDKRELESAINDYRVERVPRVTPLVLLRHHLQRLGRPWVESQVYLNPFPPDLALESRI